MGRRFQLVQGKRRNVSCIASAQPEVAVFWNSIVPDPIMLLFKSTSYHLWFWVVLFFCFDSLQKPAFFGRGRIRYMFYIFNLTVEVWMVMNDQMEQGICFVYMV